MTTQQFEACTLVGNENIEYVTAVKLGFSEFNEGPQPSQYIHCLKASLPYLPVLR